MTEFSTLVRRRAKRGQTVHEIAADLGMRPVDVRRALARRSVRGRPPLPPELRRVHLSIDYATAAKLGLLGRQKAQ
jgi:predicted transcriptional regulator